MGYPLAFGEWINGVLFGFFAAILTLWSFEFFVFWLLVFGLSVWSVKKDMYWPVGLFTVLFFLILGLTGTFNVLRYASDNPGVFALWLVAYFVCGTVWTGFRWFQYIEKMTPLRQRVILDFIKKYRARYTKPPTGPGALLHKEESSQRDAVFSPVRPYGDRDDRNLNNASEVPRPDDQLDEGEMIEWVHHLKKHGYASDKHPAINQALTEYLKSRRKPDDYSYNTADLKVDYGTATESVLWSNHKSEYSAYFFMWWLDLAVYMLSDVLNDLWRVVSASVQGAFNGYSRKRMFREIKEQE